MPASRSKNRSRLSGASRRLREKNKKDIKQSPLHLAAEAGDDGMVITLLKQGADPNARNTELYGKRTPLHLAAEEGHALCVSNLVVGGADKDLLDTTGETPLHLATQKNRLGAVEALLAAGANLDTRENCYPRDNALDIAARRRYVDVVRALVQRGSLVNASNRKGYTALHHAALVDDYLGDGDVIRVLLEAGADTEAKITKRGWTPLLLAADTDRSGDNVRALLEGGANVNARCAHGSSPLHDACLASFADVVELLLRWGADETLTDASGRTAGGRVAEWEQYGYADDDREADDEHIRSMLARAPADRYWRRRGWLVLARSCPAKVQLTKDASREGGGSDSCNDAGGGGDGARNQTRTDLERVVCGAVGLDEEGVFRSVVGFL